MRLITFTYTNEYDNRSQVIVNPALVVRLRQDADSRLKTCITFVDGSITVDGELDEVADRLAGAEPATASAVPPVGEGEEFPQVE